MLNFMRIGKVYLDLYYAADIMVDVGKLTCRNIIIILQNR